MVERWNTANLAALNTMQSGNLQDAERQLRGVMEDFQHIPHRWITLSNLGALLLRSGRTKEGEVALMEAASRLHNERHMDNSIAARAHAMLAALFTEQQEFSKAHRHHKMAYEKYDASLKEATRRRPDDQRRLREESVKAQVGMGRTLTELKRYAEAEPVLESAVAAAQDVFGNDECHLAEVQSALGVCYGNNNKFEEGLTLLRDSMFVFQEANDERLMGCMGEYFTLVKEQRPELWEKIKNHQGQANVDLGKLEDSNKPDAAAAPAASPAPAATRSAKKPAKKKLTREEKEQQIRELEVLQSVDPRDAFQSLLNTPPSRQLNAEEQKEYEAWRKEMQGHIDAMTPQSELKPMPGVTVPLPKE